LVLNIDKLKLECEFSFARSSGPGGQHVNKTDSAVLLYHKPTGVRIKTQESRSQIINKELALLKLADILLKKQVDEQLRQAKAIFKEKAKKIPKKVKRNTLRNKKIHSQKKKLRTADWED